jgi:hypothetical protein
MTRRFILAIVLLIAGMGCPAISQTLPALEKSRKVTIPDVEQPSLHVAPWVYYKPALILLTQHDTLSETVYWRRNFTDQFLETWNDARMYPASRIFGFAQDSVWYRSTLFDDYHIFVPMIYKGTLSLYYTRYIQNLGEVRMVSSDANNLDYHNNMIVTGDIPRRYANEFTYFVTFPWDTLRMIPVDHKNLHAFANMYLRAYLYAYKEALKYDISGTNKVLTWTLLPIAVVGTAAFLLVEGKPVYFIAIGAGALVTYIAVKIFLKPKTLDPEAMIGIIDKCK